MEPSEQNNEVPGHLAGNGPSERLRFAMVCASNMNRSMEAHAMLKKHGFNVGSFGVGSRVKLPGPSQSQPNAYEFGTPYEHIHADLLKKDRELYTRNGLLAMAARNMGVKRAPERWQDATSVWDVAVTFEERVMEVLVDDMGARGAAAAAAGTGRLAPLLVVNLDVRDSAEEAAVAAPQALQLCTALEAHAAACGGWEDGLEAVLDAFQATTGRRPVYSVCFY